MSPLRNWDSPNPSPASECSFPPGPKDGGGEGANSPAARGGGGSQFRRLEKKLSTLSTLWLSGRQMICRLGVFGLASTRSNDDLQAMGSVQQLTIMC